MALKYKKLTVLPGGRKVSRIFFRTDLFPDGFVPCVAWGPVSGPDWAQSGLETGQFGDFHIGMILH